MGLIIGGLIIGGMAKGAINAYSRQTEYNEKLNDLRQKSKDLTDTFNNTVSNAVADLADANRKLEANIQDATTMRDASAKSAAGRMLNQQVLNEMDMADLQIQAADQIGSATQSMAMSGTRRMTDSEGNVINAQVYRATKDAGRATDKAIARISANFFSDAESARLSYLNSNLNIEAYRREIEMNGSLELDANGNVQFDENGKVKGTGKAARSINAYKLSYDQQYNELKRDIDYMEGEGRTLNNISMFADVLGGAFGGFTKAFSFL